MHPRVSIGSIVTICDISYTRVIRIGIAIRTEQASTCLAFKNITFRTNIAAREVHVPIYDGPLLNNTITIYYVVVFTGWIESVRAAAEKCAVQFCCGTSPSISTSKNICFNSYWFNRAKETWDIEKTLWHGVLLYWDILRLQIMLNVIIVLKYTQKPKFRLMVFVASV